MLSADYVDHFHLWPTRIEFVDTTTDDSTLTNQSNVNNAGLTLNELAALHAQLLVGMDLIGTGTGGGTSDMSGVPNLVVRRPWLEPPDGYVPYDEQSVADLPAVAANVILTTITVPDGMDGVINAISWNFVGGSFSQGSGDIVVQIRRNTTPIRNFQNILVEKGTIDIPRTISPIRVYSKEVIDIFVSHAANPALNGSIVGCLQGYFYPSKG